VTRARYFAYGSNLRSARMLERVPDARLHGVACAAGYRLAFEKRGADGTGRANLAPEAGGLVWGVVWAIPESAWPVLDGFEPGYARREIEAVCAGERLRAQTYLAVDPAHDPLPVSAEYARLVLEGAREHGLPAQHLARIESLVAARR
jgi:gamma-glutamylcyclotransferase (GGCT)/AIG2-like uncharacterized protein YtfP